MTAKEQLRNLVEELSEEEAATTLIVVERGRDPLARRLDAAPIDDEPLTDEEAKAIQEGYDELDAGKGISLDQLKRELG